MTAEVRLRREAEQDLAEMWRLRHRLSAGGGRAVLGQIRALQASTFDQARAAFLRSVLPLDRFDSRCVLALRHQ
jgi:hypothetical protein